MHSGLAKVILHFNSIKVRLEPDEGNAICIFLFDFNSIKVRLERMLLSVFVIWLIFQFHKGAIRTPIRIQHDTLPFNFNSIKVRLELEACGATTKPTAISIP